MFLNDAPEVKFLKKKWSSITEAHSDRTPEVKSDNLKGVIARLLENNAKEKINVDLLSEKVDLPESDMRMDEDTPSNVTAGIAQYNPVIGAMVRRTIPLLMHTDIVGTQPMKMNNGQIFALTQHYGPQADADHTNEALVNEPDTAFSGVSSDGTKGDVTPVASDREEDPFADLYTSGSAGLTADFEGDITAEMSVKVESINVTARTRAMRSTFSREMETDLKTAHNIPAESLISNMMTDEMAAEQNRELVRKLYGVAKPGAQNDVQTAGVFDLNTDSNGRWMVERFKGLMFQLDRDANQIFYDTRRGTANFIIASADVVSALAGAGYLDYDGPLAKDAGITSDMGNTLFAGVLNKRYRVYIDPFVTVRNFVLIGYKGADSMDAGMFWCPYVPFIPEQATDPKSGQPILFFKTRYGLVSNPFVRRADGTRDGEALTQSRNHYYRKLRVDNLM